MMAIPADCLAAYPHSEGVLLDLDLGAGKATKEHCHELAFDMDIGQYYP